MVARIQSRSLCTGHFERLKPTGIFLYLTALNRTAQHGSARRVGDSAPQRPPCLGKGAEEGLLITTGGTAAAAAPPEQI